MAKTLVADVIIPTEFERYAIERTAELSRFGESGIIEIRERRFGHTVVLEVCRIRQTASGTASISEELTVVVLVQALRVRFLACARNLGLHHWR